MDEKGGFLGGKLSFDKDNRHIFPKPDLEYPKYHNTAYHPLIDEAKEYIKILMIKIL